MIYDELNYDKEVLAAQHSSSMSTMTVEQRKIYDVIMEHMAQSKSRLFFMYCYGGIGNSYIWRALSGTFHSKGEKFITVTSSGIATLLILGGRTTHSRFVIPTNVDKNSTWKFPCKIDRNSKP